MLSPLQHLWGKREPNNCCNQQLTKYKNKKGQQSTQTGTGLRRVVEEEELGEGGTKDNTVR